MFSRYCNPARLSAIGLAIATLFHLGATHANSSIAQAPLFLGGQVKPNIMMIVDNSGSMDSEILLPSNDGALWWNTTAQSFVGLGKKDTSAPGAPNYNEAGNANGTWKKFVYLFPNGTGTGGRIYGDATNDHFAVPPLPQFGWLRSAAYNGTYYDPARVYMPWVNDGTNAFVNATPSSAKSDPVSGTGTLNLTQNLASSSTNWVFRVHAGMVIPKGTRYINGTANWTTAANDVAVTADGLIGVEYYPATYYTIQSDGTYTTANTSGSCSGATPNPAHYLDFAAAPGSFVGSTGVDALGPDGRCLKRNAITDASSAEMQNFANWFQYHRKRHLTLRGSIGVAFRDQGGFRIGGFPINNRSLQGMWDIDNATQRNSFLAWVNGLSGNSGGTPNRQALNYAGQQFDGNTNVIQYSCQRNYALLFTDGFAENDTSSGVGNADGGKGAPYEDSHSNTMADIAMRYYATPLRSGLNNGTVPVSPDCAKPNPPAWLNCNKNLHMATFGITLGASGDLFGQTFSAGTSSEFTYRSVKDAYAWPPQWENPTAVRSRVQVDDLYHAAVNGRGEMFNARNAAELSDGLRLALGAILEDSGGTGAAISTNSTRLDTDTNIFQAKFDPSNGWTGSLIAFRINPDGTVGNQVWEASQVMPAPDSRKIFTRVAGTGAEFLWDSLDTTQKSSLGADEAAQKSVLNYLRGSDANHLRNNGTLRNRAKALGDIVNSDPFYVFQQNFGFDRLPEGTPGRDSYAQFRQDNEDAVTTSRPPMLYVGANDGMLHAFRADTGVEQFAYVPSSFFAGGKLAKLADPAYTHAYYVDGPSYAGHAFIRKPGETNPTWKTILLGTTGAGGRTVFALNVTDPTNFQSSDVLWEINGGDTGFEDLGFTIGQAKIAYLANGKWVAIFGNGYGASSYQSTLYVVDLETGALIRTINPITGTATEPGGLSTPALLDLNADRIVDRAYAGDLRGNVWRFNLETATTSNWVTAFSGAPLFRARYTSGTSTILQPITAPVEIGAHPDGGYMVYFGTGKYFDVGDNIIGTSPQLQSFYGVWDNGAAVGDRTSNKFKLVQQSILAESSVNGFDWRVVSEQKVNYGTGTGGGREGWFLDLKQPSGALIGERVISRALLRRGRVVFATMIPSSDPCKAGGDSWIMEMDALSGARLTYSVFDVNNDRLFDEKDYITHGQSKVPTSGRKTTEGIIKTPAVISAGGIEYKFAGGSAGGVERIVEKGGGAAGDYPRKSWKELR